MANTYIHENKTPNKNSTITKPQNTKPPPINIHGKLNYAKLLDVLKEKYQNVFQVKVTSNKLKVMFANINDFSEFKTICQKENIEYHTYTVSSKKSITVVLKELIKLPEDRICNSIKSQGLNLIECTEIPTHTKYPIYRVHKDWEKFESRKLLIQCFRCQAHRHTSANCNKNAVCVKCAGIHDTQTCSKTCETPSTCANCKRSHLANFSKCPALLAYLKKKNRIQE